jgi:pimeloyl-ACP methyl ester carboxylesterase
MKESLMSFSKLTSTCFLSANFTAKKSPIVALCGWMDGPMKPIQKYAAFFEQLGFRVIILRSQSSDIFLPTWYVQRWTSWRLGRLLKNDEWIAHIMSNGGCRSWYCLQQHLGNIKPNAMIFDSCPSYFDPDWKFPPIFFQNIQLTFVKIAVQFLQERIILPLYAHWFRIFPSTHAFSKHTQLFLREQRDIPKLFLYSSADKLIPVHAILQSITVAEEERNDFETKDFETSGHVLHFPCFPKEYIDIIAKFLRKYYKIPIENNKL